MYFVEKTFENIITNPDLLPEEFNAETSIFFDIETTGLSPKNSPVFLIGLMFFNKNNIVFRQYFSNSPTEEVAILNAFISDIRCFNTVYHFNGLSFDINFINERLSFHGIKYVLDKSTSFDIFQMVKKHKQMLGLDSCKLKSVEEYMEIFREDDLSGKEVADAYKKYVNTKSHFLRDKMLLHNEEDILNLYRILPIIKIINSKKEKAMIEVTDYSINFTEKTVLFQGKYNFDHTDNINWSDEDIKFIWDRTSKIFELEFKIQKDILYYFFRDYKNYYYFPELDQAVHKSAAKYYKYEEKQHASRDNSYVKHSLEYIKLPFELESSDIKICRIQPNLEDCCIPIEELKKYQENNIVKLIENKIIQMIIDGL